jgi:hypothetical protein
MVTDSTEIARILEAMKALQVKSARVTGPASSSGIAFGTSRGVVQARWNERDFTVIKGPKVGRSPMPKALYSLLQSYFASATTDTTLRWPGINPEGVTVR